MKTDDLSCSPWPPAVPVMPPVVPVVPPVVLVMWLDTADLTYTD